MTFIDTEWRRFYRLPRHNIDIIAEIYRRRTIKLWLAVDEQHNHRRFRNEAENDSLAKANRPK